jgi:hypothetical protein
MARHLGMLATRMGDLKLAEQHLRCAIAAAEAMPSPVFVSLSSMYCARVVLWDGRSGARERAGELFSTAIATAKASELWAIARHCRQIAEGMSLRLPAPRASDGGAVASVSSDRP